MTDFRWAVTAAYAGVALLSLAAGRNSDDRERRFWIGASTALMLMAIGKQFRLQDDLADAARDGLRHMGWYEWHQAAQSLLAALAALAALALAALLARWLRDSSRAAKAAAATLSLLVAFVLVRAASLHAMDAWATRVAWGLRLGWWIELAALVALAVCARLAPRERQQSLRERV